MKYYYTYVLLSEKDNGFYVGYSENLVKRFDEHQRGDCRSTKHRRPLVLIYYEACLTKEDAERRERYLKSGIGKKFIKMRLKKYLRPVTCEQVRG